MCLSLLLTGGGFVLYGAAASSLTLGSAPNPAVYGSAVTLTAVISPSVASGTVTFYDGVAILGTSSVSNGAATLVTRRIPSGTRTLKAYYSGVTSGAVTETVNTVLGAGFSTAVTYTGAFFPIGIRAADINGDGFLDLLAANPSGGNVIILRGNGDGTFSPGGTASAGTGARAIAIDDFNNDGKTDLAVANENSGGTGSVSILLANGDGTFQTAVSYNTGANPRSILIADFNNDGKADLAIGNFADGTVSIRLGNGDGTFQTQLIANAGASVQSIAAGDFNGDGKTDLAIANSGLDVNGNTVTAGSISIILGNGNGTFQSPTTLTAGNNPVAIVAVDLNNDTRTDLIVTDLNSSDVSAFLGNGNGTFQAVIKTNAGASPSAIVTGDFNGDGKQDVAVSNQSSATVTVLLGNGAGSFTAETPAPTGNGPDGLALGDFNGDGRIDLATTDFTGAGISVFIAQSSTSSVTLAASTNPSVYGRSVTFTATVTPSNATGSVAFYDGPSVLGTAALVSGQAVFATSSLPSGVNYLKARYLGNSLLPVSTSSTLTQTVNAVPGRSFPSTQIAHTGSSDARHLVTADFNRDGKPDVAVANFTGGNVSVLLGNGDGTLGTSANYTTGAGTRGIVTADFNGDGIPDLATSNVTAGNVSVLIGAANGNFAAAVNYTIGSSAALLAAADFNNDGIEDLAVTTNGSSGTFTILLGRGDGTFQTGSPISGGAFADAIVTADFNNDGFADLAIGGDGGTLTIYFGNGDGTFRTPIVNNYGSVTFIDGATNDFNADGIPDLVLITNVTGGTAGAIVLLGYGDGSFQAPGSYVATSGRPLTVTTADFNGDGIIDFATAGSRLTIFYGKGNGTFQTATTFNAGSNPGAIGTADMNGDGRVDIVVADTGTVTIGSVNVVLGATPSSSTLNLVSSLNPANYSTAITLTASINPSNATGKITFFDGAAILGIAALSNGSASLITYTLAPGAHSFHAYYGGTAAALPSTSNSITQTVTALSQNGFKPPEPLNAGSGISGGTQSMARADFNGDGIIDLAIVNSQTNAIGILLNQGSGTFHAPVS